MPSLSPSVLAGNIYSDGLVVSKDGIQDIIVESTTSSSTLSVNAPNTAALTLENSNIKDRACTISSVDERVLGLSLSGQKRLEVGSYGNTSDVKLFTPLYSHVAINDNLLLTANSIRASNSTLELKPSKGKHIHIETLAGARTLASGNFHMDGALKISLPAETYVFYARVVTETVNSVSAQRGLLDLGTIAEPTNVKVWGPMNIMAKTQIVGNLQLTKGNLRLGNADIQVGDKGKPGSLGVGGDTILGSNTTDTVQISSTVTVVNENIDVVTINPRGGTLVTKGTFTADDGATLGGDVILGTALSDTVVIHAASTVAENINASGSAVLGSQSSHEVAVYGGVHLTHKGSRMFSVDHSKGNVVANANLSVAGHSNFTSSVRIGSRMKATLTTNETQSSQPISLIAENTAEFFAPVHLNSGLAVQGKSTLTELRGASLTVNGDAKIFDGANTMLSLDRNTGDFMNTGRLDAQGDVTILHNFSTGPYKTTSVSDMHLKHTTGIVDSLSVGQNMTVDGDVSVSTHISAGSLTAYGDVYIGQVQSVHEVQSDLLVSSKNQLAVLHVNPRTGDTRMDGRFTVRGTSSFLANTTIDSTATVHGRSHFAELQIGVAAVISGNASMANTEVKESMHVKGSVVCEQSAALSSLGNSLQIDGELVVYQDAKNNGPNGTNPFLLVNSDTAKIFGELVAKKDANFDFDTDLGSATGAIDVFATVKSTALVSFNALAHAKKSLTVQGVFTQESRVKSQLSTFRAAGDVTLGQGDATTTIDGALRFINPSGADLFSVQSTGDMLIKGQLTVGGDMTVSGTMAAQRFTALDIKIEQIVEKQTDKGVLIEDVLLRDGAIEKVKINQMVELISEKGVTIEQMNAKGGALVLQAKRAGASPRGNLAILQLENKNHAAQMANVSTSLLFQQFYHDSKGKNAPHDSARITVSTQNSWTNDVFTRNSRMTLQTTHKGNLRERMRLSPSGDLLYNTDKMTMDSTLGHMTTQGSVFIGGNPVGNNTLQILSASQAATLLMSSGGAFGTQANSLIKFGFGQTSTEFNFINVAATEVTAAQGAIGALHLVDETTAIVLALNQRGSLHVSGSITTGELAVAGDQTLKLNSAGGTSLNVASGISSDAKFTITAGKDQKAEIKLVDPAAGVQGSTFSIINDGGANSTLHITDGTNNLLTVVDKGDVGNLKLAGDLTLSSRGEASRVVRVISSRMAEVKMNSNADSTVRLTSGLDMDSKIVFTDVISQISTTKKEVFEIVNVGVPTNAYSGMLRFQRNDRSMMSIVDDGEVSNMNVTGNAYFGDLLTKAAVSVKVSSGAAALLAVTSSNLADATLSLHSTKSSVLQLEVETSKTKTSRLSTFSVSGGKRTNNGNGVPSLWTTTLPTLRITSKMAAGADLDLLHIVDQGLRGDIAMEGNTYINGLQEKQKRKLSLNSMSSAKLLVSSGSNDTSTLLIQSQPDGSPTIKFDDLEETHKSFFAISNEGTFNLEPKVSIKDKNDNVLFQIKDIGSVGDIIVSGDAKFGETSASDRVLAVASMQQSSVVVTSGASSHANFSLIAGGQPNADVNSSLKFLPRTNVSVSSELGFQVVRRVNSTENVLDVMYKEHSMMTLTDTGSAGSLHVTGSATIGNVSSPQRKLTVLSKLQSSFTVKAGDFDDAAINMESGPNQDCKITYRTGATGFDFSLDGKSARPTLNLQDVNNDTMLNITDMGTSGTADFTGDAMFGLTTSTRTVSTKVTGKKATLEITGSTAVMHIKGGNSGKHAQLILATQPSLREGVFYKDFFMLRNEGRYPGAKGSKGGRMSLRNAFQINDTILELRDTGTQGDLEFSGSTTFVSTEKLKLSVDVNSGAAASVTVVGGDVAQLKLTSAADKDQKLTLSSMIVQPDIAGQSGWTSYKSFSLLHKGAGTTYPELQILDAAALCLTIRDVGPTAVVSVTGALAVNKLDNKGHVTLGANANSEVNIVGHIKTQTIHFDADRDGTAMSLQFEDPTKPQTITMPSESGIVLTTASQHSTLSRVGALTVGSIGEGFGNIQTSSDIETTDTLSVAGSFTANNAFHANGDVTIGDASTDTVSMRGAVQTTINMANGFGFSLVSDNGKKTSTMKAAFLSNNAASPTGDRVIIIPDSPSGGSLHVVFSLKVPTTASNVHQVTNDATAGVIVSAVSDTNLASQASRILNLVNKRVKSTSTVIATINNYGDVTALAGGWVMVTAVKIGVGGGSCTIIVQNIHPSRAMTTGYSISFSVFNPA